MFVLKGFFEIGDFRFTAINEVEIMHTVEEIADTAIIKMPKKFLVKDNGQLKYTEEAIKVGDQVSITIGYKGKYEKEEFVGFVDRIKYSTPMEIYCEDATWLLKRKQCLVSKKNTTLKEVLESVVSGTGIKLAKNIIDKKLEKWVFKGNGGQALAKLKSDFPYSIYLNDEGELYCGLQQMNNFNQVAIYDLNYNIVENSLEFKSTNDKKIKVVYESISKSNKKIKVEVGDDGGDKIEVKTKTISDLPTLERMAKAHLEKAKYDGYSGEVTSFLLPYATRGMAAEIIDKKRQNRKDKYFIKKVVTTYGMSGARRKVSISNKL